MRPAITVVVTALLLGLTARWGAPVERGGWNRESAARYLDERMDVWFANAKKLQTGAGQTTCVSCHTTIPYMLSRSGLRRAMHVSRATPQEVRLLEEATRRVETYGAHQLLYDSDERKKAESRGTEAVLNALVLARADAEHARRVASEPTRRALRRLWETQRSDGAWDWLDFGLEPFESVDAAFFGATLAALATGTSSALSTSQATDEAAGVDKLRGYLRAQYPRQSLFNRVWALLASTRLKDLLTPAQREALIGEIQRRQHDDGGWSLQALGPWRWSRPAAPFRAPGTLDASLLAKSDGYATGLIVYTLREAGLPVDHPAVRRGLQWLRASQQDVQVSQRTRSAWPAHSLNFDREHGGERGEPWRRMFMSDAATAFAVLALIGSD
jgi:squalene-hopene/tetraprenyl-beta-curcumene cyclase